MFLPIGDHPNPPRTQWVTRGLLVANIAVHLFWSFPLSTQGLTEEDLQDPGTRSAVERMWSFSRDYEARRGRTFEQWLGTVDRYSVYVFRNGYKPGEPTLLALFLCMFLHADWLHLLGNMLYLWIFGDNVEARIGSGKYVLAYLGTGVAATLSFAMLNSDSLVPLVGASGAISGVLGFYLVWFPHNLIRVVVWLFLFIQVFFIRAYWVLLVYLVVDNLLMSYLRGGAGGVAHAAHIGGFVAGMGLGWIIDRVRNAPPAPRPEFGPGRQPYTYQRVGQRAPERVVVDHGAAFRKALRAGDMRAAAHAFAKLIREGGGTPDARDVFRLAYWLYEQGYVPDAVAVFRFYIRNFPRGSDLDRVHLGLGILLARRLHQPAAAREHLLAAIDLAADDTTIAETARAELARL